MSYILYGDKGSGAFSAEAVLAETGAPYEFKVILARRSTSWRKPTSFLAIKPEQQDAGAAPARGSQIVTESLAILLTLADHFPTARLLPPQAGPARTQAYRWLAFMASEIYPMVEISDYPDRFVEKDHAPALRQKARARIRERLLIVERMVDGPWFLASGFSIVDIYAAMFSRWRGSIGADWLKEGHIPKLETLAQAVSKRPAIAPVWQRHFGN